MLFAASTFGGGAKSKSTGVVEVAYLPLISFLSDYGVSILLDTKGGELLSFFLSSNSTSLILSFSSFIRSSCSLEDYARSSRSSF
jgi:hypothetical protein